MTVGYFEPLDPEECRRLLASKGVARVAFVAAGGELLVLPVAYVLDGDGTVVFSTSRQSPLAALAAGGPATVQVDDVAEDLEDGWSILGQGSAAAYEGTARPRPWIRGAEPVVVGIRLTRLTGRAVSAG